MIKFFRKIRRRLLTENKFSKYLFYAIGEILLVVLGILIALQINIWRQESILLSKEQAYLVELNDEFNNNLNLLIESINQNQLNMKAGKQILELFNSGQSDVEESTLSRLLFDALTTTIEFRTNNSVLNEMISSGSITNLSNKQLKKHLVAWKPALEQLVIQENLVELYRKRCLHLIADKGSIRTGMDAINITTDFLGISKAKGVKKSNLHLLGLTRLENELLLFIISCKILESTYHENSKKEIEEILILIEKKNKE